MGLWSKKSISLLQAEAAAEGSEVTLRRALGALNLTMLGIGAIIGAGIFVLTGTAAAQYAGQTMLTGVINLPAIILVGLMSTLLVIGIKESASFNNVIVFVKVAIVLLVIVFGFMYVKTANWHPFIPPGTGEFGHFGWSGIV